MKVSGRAREKKHAELRSVEVELGNTLGGINDLLDRLTKSVKARDCMTARTNFDQLDLAFRSIGKKLGRVAQLYRELKIQPGSVEPRRGGVHTAPPPPKAPAKKGKR
jgi:hypothetical protein